MPAVGRGMGVAGRAREPGRRQSGDQRGIERSQCGQADMEHQVPTPPPSTVVLGKPFQDLGVTQGAGVLGES